MKGRKREKRGGAAEKETDRNLEAQQKVSVKQSEEKKKRRMSRPKHQTGFHGDKLICPEIDKSLSDLKQSRAHTNTMGLIHIDNTK